MQLESTILNGLVLAGGKSSRMGTDKSAIRWHGPEQVYYVAKLLESYCDEVFISRRNDQLSKPGEPFQTIHDIAGSQGPLGAILSAFNRNPFSAWLVVACDLPLIDKTTLEYLSNNRNREAIATTFKSPFDGLPEPLVTIWEPKSYPLLLNFKANGYTCPRKVLINCEGVHILSAPDPDALMNVNTPEDVEKARKIISQKEMMDKVKNI